MGITAACVEEKPIVSLETTTKIALVVEYNGTRYHGFQWQIKRPTIQGELEKALEKLTGERIRVMGAGRTDAGVHARGQVVSFVTGSSHSRKTFVNGLNYYLPGDIAVKAAYRVNDSFNVRRHAVRREYNYYILNSQTRSPLSKNFSCLVTGHLDTEAMHEACQVLIGEHDFASFVSNLGAGTKSTVRRVYQAGVTWDGEMVIFNIVANSFLTHQVRNIVGALIKVGQDRMTGDDFRSIMEAKEIGLARPTALACGLCLMRVEYTHPLDEEVFLKSCNGKLEDMIC